MADRHHTRRQRLLHHLRETGVDALLVSGETNVTWLTGFTGDSSWMLLGRSRCVIMSDSRYETQLQEECPGLELAIRTTDVKLSQLVARTVASAGIRRLGFESHLVTIEQMGELTQAVGHVEFVPVPWRTEELRAIKDASEIAEIREAVRLAARGFEFLRATLTRETTELSAAHELEHALRRLGADGTSFPPIIATDDRAALAHYRPGRRPIGESRLLLVDWGAQTLSRYKSDLTRVLIFGKPAKKLKTVYDVVLEAQLRAIAAIGPGVTCQTVDAAARSYIAENGYGARFGHGLGHGIGLNVHELPRFAPNATTVLSPGMIVTVEPGIYLPGWGGVRIEDDILVTRDGCEVLSALVPKSFDSALTAL
jgi:Xaa-Pro aminopeptidase